jgi:formylglycine-generating enzyme required for sulfatase activity
VKRALVLLALTGVIVTIAVAWQHYRAEANAEQLYADRNEMEVRITNLGGARLSLFHAGKNMSDARLLTTESPNHFSLPPGNYFIKAETSGDTLYYPISSPGYGLGPVDGRFDLTIRPYPAEFPPGAFAYVPSGYFLLGDRLNPQEPHYVWLGAFFAGASEVTNCEYRKFLEDPHGYSKDSNWTEAGKTWRKNHASNSSATLQQTDSDFARFGKNDQPIVNVTWFEANAFCKWLTAKTDPKKWLFSLPSEAEWEKAARGPDSFDYGLSNTISDAEVRLYNWKKNPDAPETVVTQTNTSFLPNRYGIYHMSGNVAEWTQSEFLSYNRNHPYDEYERNRDSSMEQRVVRGGSWYSASIALLYLPYRDAFQPEHSSKERGFRVVAQRLP